MLGFNIFFIHTSWVFFFFFLIFIFSLFYLFLLSSLALPYHSRLTCQPYITMKPLIHPGTSSSYTPYRKWIIFFQIFTSISGKRIIHPYMLPGYLKYFPAGGIYLPALLRLHFTMWLVWPMKGRPDTSIMARSEVLQLTLWFCYVTCTFESAIRTLS